MARERCDQSWSRRGPLHTIRDRPAIDLKLPGDHLVPCATPAIGQEGASVGPGEPITYRLFIGGFTHGGFRPELRARIIGLRLAYLFRGVQVQAGIGAPAAAIRSKRERAGER